MAERIEQTTRELVPVRQGGTMTSADDTPCGWCGHRWDLHNHVTDECHAALASGLDACECPGWEAPV